MRLKCFDCEYFDNYYCKKLKDELICGSDMEAHSIHCDSIINEKENNMKLTKRYPILGSSQDETKLSLTIKSSGIALIPLLIAIARGFGLDIAENDLVQVINAIAGITAMAGVIVGLTTKYLIKIKGYKKHL